MSIPQSQTRHDWTREEAKEIHNLPFPELLFQAQSVHRQHHDPSKVQFCSLLSIKTGLCPEDCSYCPQSAHYSTEVEGESLMDVDEVLKAARSAKDSGASRFCMGAAWREVKDGEAFDQVLEMVRGVRSLGMEACCTLGMLTDDQASRLAEAGLTAYNHNLDTGPEYYDKIISTRSYEDRLETLKSVRKSGVTICSGGIIGMGEKLEDRLEMLCVLASFSPHPESVPINALLRSTGTPLADRPPVPILDMVRMIATARILLPTSMVRLSAGRIEMSKEGQALCFLAGANSIFTGETLLTQPNPGRSDDHKLLDELGMTALEPPTACAPDATSESADTASTCQAKAT